MKTHSFFHVRVEFAKQANRCTGLDSFGNLIIWPGEKAVSRFYDNAKVWFDCAEYPVVLVRADTPPFACQFFNYFSKPFNGMALLQAFGGRLADCRIFRHIRTICIQYFIYQKPDLKITFHILVFVEPVQYFHFYEKNAASIFLFQKLVASFCYLA